MQDIMIKQYMVIQYSLYSICYLLFLMADCISLRNQIQQSLLMNLLPKNYSEFKEKQYWNSFFKTLNNKDSFQWYGSFLTYRQPLFIILNQLSTLNHKNKTFKIAHLGCGNSSLAEDIVQGYPIYSIMVDNYDYSEEVISEMKKKNKKGDRLSYEVCDLFQEISENKQGKYDMVLDKGTLDAVLPEDQQQNIKEIQNKYFTNVKKMLKGKTSQASSYVIISMLQQFILKTILTSFSSKEYSIKIYERWIADSEVQPFLIEIRYSRQMEVQEQKERCIELVRLNKTTKLFKDHLATITQILQIQQMNRYTSSIQQLRKGQISKFTIFLPNSEILRYNLEIVDHNTPLILQKNTCSVFIVPQGMQNLPMFNTETGLRQFQDQLKTSRVIIVKLIIGQKYKDIQQIKKQLNNILPSIIQKNCNVKEVPYLTHGSIGERHYLFEDEEIIVEQVLIEDSAQRRVVLKSHINLVQSVFKLEYFSEEGNPDLKGMRTRVLPEKKGFFVGIDNSQLDEGYCRIIVSFVTKFLNKSQKYPKFLHLGGAGCAIAKFLHHKLQNSDHLILQKSKSIFKNGGKYFEWPQKRFKVLNEDALCYVQKLLQQKESFDCIILDISNQEKQTQFYPPLQFLQKTYITTLKNLLNPQGILIINTIPPKNNNSLNSLTQLDFPFIYKSLHKIDNEIYLLNKKGYVYVLENDKQVIRIQDGGCLKIKENKWEEEGQQYFAMVKPTENYVLVGDDKKKK